MCADRPEGYRNLPVAYWSLAGNPFLLRGILLLPPSDLYPDGMVTVMELVYPVYIARITEDGQRNAG